MMARTNKIWGIHYIALIWKYVCKKIDFQQKCCLGNDLAFRYQLGLVWYGFMNIVPGLVS